MKKLLLRNLFWINFVFLVLPVSLLIPALQSMEELSPLITLLALLIIGVANFLSVMLVIFVLNGLYGKAVAIFSFIGWIIVASQGSIGLLASVCITAGYWIYQRKHIDRFGKKLGSASEAT